MKKRAVSFRFYDEVVAAWEEEAAASGRDLTTFVEEAANTATDEHARRAHRIAREALQAGELVAQGCQECGKEPAEMHHDDYDQPLQVRWLCKRHHRLWHADHPTGIRWNQLTFRIPDELQQRLKIFAIQNDRTIQEILNGLVEAYLRKKDGEAE